MFHHALAASWLALSHSNPASRFPNHSIRVAHTRTRKLHATSRQVEGTEQGGAHCSSPLEHTIVLAKLMNCAREMPTSPNAEGRSTQSAPRHVSVFQGFLDFTLSAENAGLEGPNSHLTRCVIWSPVSTRSRPCGTASYPSSSSLPPFARPPRATCAAHKACAHQKNGTHAWQSPDWDHSFLLHQPAGADCRFTDPY